ncbi:MAG: hypothetical protein V4714_02515 [Bacteroidota bacterium]
MKALTFCLLILTITSCQRYVVVSTHEGVDVHLQGNRIVLFDTVNNYRSYFVKGAYKQFSQNHDLNSLLAKTKETKLVQAEINTTDSRYVEKKAEKSMKQEVILNASFQ